MAKKDKKENFKNMKESELEKSLATFTEDIRVLRFKAKGAKSKNVKEESALRKQIARVMTEMNRK